MIDGRSETSKRHSRSPLVTPEHLLGDSSDIARIESESLALRSARSVPKSSFKEVKIIYEHAWLEDYQKLMPNIVRPGKVSDADDIFRLPLNFKPFVDHCKAMLETVLTQKFKKDQAFKDLLITICKAEALSCMLQGTKFLQ